MVHGVSGERVAYVSEAAGETIPDGTEAGAWHLFEYRHTDLTYPLLVRFNDAEGPELPYELDRLVQQRVWMVDFERSALTSDGFRGTSRKEPVPYGMWVRLREAVEDAFRCWPSTQTLGKHPDRIILKGGWFGDWSPGVARLSAHRNAMFNQFNSPLIDDLPPEFVGFNPVPLDTMAIRFWDVFVDSPFQSSIHYEQKHVSAPARFYAGFGELPDIPQVLLPWKRGVDDVDEILTARFSRSDKSMPLSNSWPQWESPGSVSRYVDFSLGVTHRDLFGHRDYEYEWHPFRSEKFPNLRGLPRYLSRPSGVGCSTNVPVQGAGAGDLLQASCFVSKLFQNASNRSSFEDSWRGEYKSYPIYSEWRLGRECLEAISGSNHGSLLYDLHVPPVHSSWLKPRKALMTVGSYVGGDLSLEPYNLTFIYTDQKPAGMEWISKRNPATSELGAKLADCYGLS